MLVENKPSSATPSARRLNLKIITDDVLKLSQQVHSSFQNTKDANELYMLSYKILKLGGLEAEIPRLVVFGQQSMGKTTLLDYIMGGPIGYSSSDTGTKQPIVILIKPSSDNKSRATLAGHAMSIDELQNKMKNIMQAAQESISANELEVEIELPGAVHAVFVDLPGIKDDTKGTADLTRSIVRSYVRNNPNDLYLLVKRSIDDPANWSYSLKEYMFEPCPKGLGLSSYQTIVVGTRALEFLQNERTDISSKDDLLKRVKKRTIKDHRGIPLQLHMLELFSLSLDAKECPNFERKRAMMHDEITKGQEQVKKILTVSFQPSTDPAIDSAIDQTFSRDFFDSELNRKFQGLIVTQMGFLDRGLRKYQIETSQTIRTLEQRIVINQPQSIREVIKLFIREVMQTANDMITGNFTIMKFADSGSEFLSKYGGNLDDNLGDGHKLAMEMFPDKTMYDPNFLTTISKVADSEVKRLNENLRTTLQPSYWVRYHLSKENSYMLGNVRRIVHPETEAETRKKNAQVMFFYSPGNAVNILPTEGGQIKLVEEGKLIRLIPFSEVYTTLTEIPKDGRKLWLRFMRDDGWVGLKHVEVDDIYLESPHKDIEEDRRKGSPSSTVTNYKEPRIEQPVSREMLYIDVDNPERIKKLATQTLMQRISGEYADTKLLNQLCLTHLSRWLKFNIGNLEPEKKYPDNVMLQMMRSVRHVQDKADWEPFVADLLQVNVRGGLLSLARLSACAASCALRRIFRASIVVTKKKLKNRTADQVHDLVESTAFMNDLEKSLDEYCKTRAYGCANAMRDIIFEQTYCVSFDAVEDYFNGCQRFETEFLSSKFLLGLGEKVKTMLSSRKQKLGTADVYTRDTMISSPRTPAQLIHDEVRVQYWVVKMTLQAPLTTKLYMHFIKDIKDKTSHLAAEMSEESTIESNLEIYLQSSLLCTQDAEGRKVHRPEAELMEMYSLKIDRERIIAQLEGLKRVNEYIKLATDGIAKLRSALSQGKSVDFLTKMGKRS